MAGRANYLEQARQKAAELVAAGYLLDEDEAAAIGEVEAQLRRLTVDFPG